MGAPTTGVTLGGDAAAEEGACRVELVDGCATTFAPEASADFGTTSAAQPACGLAGVVAAAVLLAFTARFFGCGAVTPSRDLEAAGARFFFAAPCGAL